jgi:hypothetical protein
MEHHDKLQPGRLIMRYSEWLFVPLLMLSSMALAKTDAPEVTVDGLHRVETKAVDLLYVRPGTDLSAYGRVFLLKPEIRFVENYQAKANRLYKFRITDEDMEQIREDLAAQFAKVFYDELQTRGGYPLVTELGEGVLVVRPAIIDLDVLAPAAIDRPNSRSALPSAGRMTLYLELADGVSNAVLARVLDYQYDRTMVKPYKKNSERNEEAARQILQHWATLLREALDAARNGTPANRALD